ncbi:transglutaminase-like domain-containing protein [Patescibacteria group bacterium]|nr:transglutaminase-like domain-containing protein [Patescibacteria group bacterium]
MRNFLRILLFSLLLIPTKVLASENNQFSINYDLEYDVLESGETQVTQRTTITNLKNDYVPTNYSFTAKHMAIYDVEAVTNGESSEAIIETREDETLISVIINNYAIGEGRQNYISFTYKTTDIAKKTGKIWNIYIPRIQIPETTTLYNVKLLIPEDFGPKIYLSPTPVIERAEEKKNAYYLTKETFVENGITAAFGEYQSLNFKLKYQLENTSILPLIREISLPPDIEEVQQVNYLQIEPKPKRLKTDEDGNTIAWYILGPKKKLEISVTGIAKISGKQINPDFGRETQSIPSDLIRKYTGEEKFWQVNSPNIQKAASELKDTNLNTIKNAQKVYNYVIQNLTYDFKALEEGPVERHGAEVALTQKGQWTCMEFTDLFVTLTRAMGIPAREVNGYAFTNNELDKPLSINLQGGDVLHSWAEFYDPFYGWIQVDPTWGSTSGIDYFTKLDTNHFTFVIKGIDSEYPYPAGAYRFSDDEKLVDVELSQQNSEGSFKPSLEIKKKLNLNIVELIKGNEKYKITNNSGVFVYNLEGKTLPPGASTTLYLSKNLRNIAFEDINHNKYSVDL